MKNTIIKLFISVSAVLLCIGCSKGEGTHDFENKVFISANTFAEQYRVQTDEKVNEMTAELSVAMSDLENKDVNVTFRVAPELIDRYRMAYYDDNAKLLPESNYELQSFSVKIPAGSIKSNSLNCRLTGLLGLDYSENYILPVTIESTDGPAVLESARTMYLVIKEASLINVVADLYKNCAWPDWSEFDEVADMEEFTMEALVKATAFNNDSNINTIMGIEDLFLIRVGDTTIPKNQIQIATAKRDDVNNTTYRNNVSDPALKLNLDRWYHIAVTFDRGIVKVYLDGKMKASGDFSGGDIQLKSVNFKVKHSDESDNQPRCFWVGYSYDNDRSFNGSMAEVRMWNRALTEEEINAPNHFYKINTKDPSQMAGLVAYWKFNDKNGSTVKDYSGFGNDLQSASSIVWKDVELPLK
ncbi:MAG: DUF1735 and LamG domain-containing protein [Bacteroidales bacterium]|nr:DUF1735 and LamG domain-containing protein [Bacteroidales bacterium]